MSKSLDNYIALTDTPREIFGKVMSIPDSMITRYLQYAALADIKTVEQVKLGLENNNIHPRDAKVDVAKRVVAMYHGLDAGENALIEFEKIFKNKDCQTDIEEHIITYTNG